MKRGVTYIATLVSICLLYFGSLYIVSRPTTGSLTSLVNEKSELTNRESVEKGGVQVPLFESDEYIGNEEILIKKEKAVIVILVRNNELGPMRRTLRQFEE